MDKHIQTVRAGVATLVMCSQAHTCERFLIFRCPATGFDMQTLWAPHDREEKQGPHYESVTCPAKRESCSATRRRANSEQKAPPQGLGGASPLHESVATCVAGRSLRRSRRGVCLPPRIRRLTRPASNGIAPGATSVQSSDEGTFRCDRSPRCMTVRKLAKTKDLLTADESLSVRYAELVKLRQAVDELTPNDVARLGPSSKKPRPKE